MIDDISIDKPATLCDIEQLIITVRTDNSFVKSEEYRRLIKISKTQFSYLKKLGRFDRGTHKATLGCRHILIHKNFNMHSQRIELPENEKSMLNKKTLPNGSLPYKVL
jgi:hypothetical protein